MYIYKNNDNNIEAYELKAKAQQLIKYRREKLQSIPKEELIKEAYCGGWITPPFDKQAIIDVKLYDYREYDNYENTIYSPKCYHFLSNIDWTISIYKDRFMELLKCYYNGLFANQPVIRMQYENDIKYYLLTKNGYETINKIDMIKKMDRIIQLPKCLYLLQLLEQGKYSLIKPDEDIDEQLALFDIKFIDRFSKSTLAKMDRCGITNNALEKVNTYTGNDVLKRVLK